MALAKTRMKPQHFFVPITRFDAETGEFEGMAFVNEVVEGEGGVRLKRSAMEAATADFLRYGTGALREMHRMSAAGIISQVEWKPEGCFVSGKVVDRDAKEKCREKVYKGLSVGVVPRMMRGKDVESCAWPETSLVDRPKDPDAVLTMYRADGFNPAADVEVEILPALDDRVTLEGGGEGQVTGFNGDYCIVRVDGAETGQEFCLRSPDLLTIRRVDATGTADNLNEFTEEQLELPESESGEVEAVPPTLYACFVPDHEHTTLESAYGCMLSMPEAAVAAMRERGEDAVTEPAETEVERAGITSENSPSRENLEGGKEKKKPRLRGALHYNCGEKSCHGHLQHAAAQRCMERSMDYVPSREGDDGGSSTYAEEPGLTRGLFAGQLVSIAQEDQVQDFQLLWDHFTMVLYQIVYPWPGGAYAADPTDLLVETVEEFCAAMLNLAQDNGDEFTGEASERSIRPWLARVLGEPEGGVFPPQVLRADGEKAKGDYGSADEAGYADPGLQADKKPRYPLKENGKLSADRIRAAWSYINKSKNREPYSAENLSTIEGHIKSAAKEAGVEISSERCDDMARVEGGNIVASYPAADPIQDPALLTRIEGLTTENGSLLTRAETAESEVAIVRAELSTATERIERFLAEPDPRRDRPILYSPVLRNEDRTAANPEAQKALTRMTEIQQQLRSRDLPSDVRVKLTTEHLDLRRQIGG